MVRHPQFRLILGRLMLALAAVIGLALLVIARNLEPDTRGYGTHEQLGLTPCYFQSLTGRVCPMCGCTTAWAHATRGQLRLAATANLGGTLLCVAAAIGVPWALLAAVLGRWPVMRPTMKLILMMVTAWSAVVVLDWLRRIYLGL